MHKFVFCGHSSLEFGIYISGENTFNGPEKDYETVDVPGRNGSLLIDKNRLKNISVSYPAYIRKGFRFNAQAARNWLLASEGYQRLEDDYHPDLYRLAYFAGPIDFDMRFLNLSGEVELTFQCKPQRWLKSGEFPIALTSGQSLHNAWQTALPLIDVTGQGNGVLTVGASIVQITGMAGGITLDSEVQNAYQGTVNKNSAIQLTGGFPTLPRGDTVISWSGGITGVKITPRWWTV